VIRPSVIAAGLVLATFVLANLLNDGFPLTHVERRLWGGATMIRSDGKAGETFTVREPDKWDAQALTINVLVGAMLTLAAGIIGSEVGRWLREPPAG
jgi:hypothetical protein